MADSYTPLELAGGVPSSHQPPVGVRPELISHTARYKRLARLDAYYCGEQYKGMPDWWTGGNPKDPVPLRERAPCVVYPLPKAAVNQATRFTFGESRFPTIKVEEVEAGDAIAPALALTKDDAEVLSKGIADVIKQAKLRAGMRTLERRGLSACTAVAVLAVRGGRFEVDKPHARDCIPTFRTGSSTELDALTICYQFQKLIPNRETGEPEYKPHFYRRDITTVAYVVYADVLIEQGKEVVWTVLEEIPHRLGFCPAVWIRNLGDEYDGDPDGCSLYEGLEDEFDALNLALSQRHRGIHFWGVPQPWEAGVDEGDIAPAQRNGRTTKGDKGQVAAARKIGPDNILSYKDPKTVLGLLETTGAAFDAATKHVLDVRARILEAIDVVLLDPTAIAESGEVSGKALSYVYAPLLGLVDELRECWWSEGLEAILSMMLRIIAALGGKGIYLPRIGKIAAIVKRFLITEEGETKWLPPTMTPMWGDYFSPSNAEIKVAVDTAIEAAGVVVSKKTAVRSVASYFAVNDVDAELDDLEEDSAEAAQKALDMAAHGVVPGPDGKPKPTLPKPAAAGAKPKPPEAQDPSLPKP